MDNRDTRRAAEKAARELINARASLIGDLAHTHSATQHTTNAISTAKDQAAQLLATAHTQGQQLIAEATADAGRTHDAYSDAHTAALTAGWTKTELVTLGYQPPTSRRKPTTTATTASGGGDTNGADHNG